MTDRPNILFLLGESHAPDLLAAAGHPVIHTPNLDSLAKRGALFEHAYCASPLCVPARAALATGRFPHESGYWDSSLAYDGAVPSWMGRLRDSGYQTAGIGKMHFRSDEDDVGFTSTVETMQIADGIGDLVSALRHEGSEPSYQGLWDIWTSRYGAGDDNPYRQFDERIALSAENWLAKSPGETPWALSVHFISAHAPFVTPREFFELYKPEDIPPPIRFSSADRPDHPSVRHLRQIVPHADTLPYEQVQALRAAYFATVTYLDALIGRVLDALQASGQASNTLIVYTSDHGFSLGDHYVFGLFHMYEESLRVPLIVAGPGISENRRIPSPVSHTDIYPTFLEAAGIPLNEDEEKRLAKSLWPVLRGEQVKPEPVFAEYHGTGTRSGGYVLRRENIKLIHFIDMPPQLFDLEHDPEEAVNLAEDPAFAALYLARANKRVLLCEKGRIAGEQSSRNWGWVRQQGRDVAELPIMMRALKLWHEVNRETKGGCGLRTGGTCFMASTDAAAEGYDDWLKIAREHALESRLMSSREVNDHFNGQAAHPWKCGLTTPSDAQAEPWRAVPAVAALAQQSGVIIRENCVVRALDYRAGRISGVVTESGVVKSEQVILAAGAWSSLFARRHDIRFPQLTIRGTVAKTGPLQEVFNGSACDEELGIRQREDGGYTLALADSHSVPIGPDSFRHALAYLPLMKSSWRAVELLPA